MEQWKRGWPRSGGYRKLQMRGPGHSLDSRAFLYLSGKAQKLIERNFKLMNILGSEGNV